jgi:hypothetical protein
VTDTADDIRPPRTIVAAFVATIAAVGLSVVSAALWWGYQNYLRHEFVKANAKLKPTDKNFKKDYTVTSHAVNHDVHNWLTSGLVQSLLFGLALVLVAVNMRRGKSWARWLLLILFAIPLLPTAAPYRLLTIAGSAPALTRVTGALTGLAGLAVIVLLVMPESSRYFAAVRAEQLGDRAEGAAPLGLRGIFSPRMPPDRGASTTNTATKPSQPSKRSRPATPPLPEKPVAVRPAEPAPTPPAAKQAKAKVRASPEPEASSTPARSASSVAAKSRSKSRKGS